MDGSQAVLLAPRAPRPGAFGGWLAGAEVAAAPAPEITATTAPTLATSPTLKRISVSVPLVVDGTSIDVLSVSISNRLSPWRHGVAGRLEPFRDLALGDGLAKLRHQDVHGLALKFC
jgi:hypothetical protein